MSAPDKGALETIERVYAMLKHGILVDERDSTISAFMAEALSDEGYAVECCQNGGMTIEHVQHTHPDLLILDLQPAAPHATLGFLHQLRRDGPTSTIPVLVSSTDARLLNTLDAPLRDCGCTILVKPFDLDQFLNCVAQALKSSVYEHVV